MRSARRLFRHIAAGWLVCQLAGLIAAPLALCCDDEAHAAPPSTKACCKAVKPGQTCPMHHTQSDGTTCRMRTACGRSAVAFIALATGAGVLPRPAEPIIALNLLEPVDA